MYLYIFLLPSLLRSCVMRYGVYKFTFRGGPPLKVLSTVGARQSWPYMPVVMYNTPGGADLARGDASVHADGKSLEALAWLVCNTKGQDELVAVRKPRLSLPG